MKPVYINSAVCLSAQPTLEADFFSKLEPKNGKSVLEIIAPPYKEYIPANLIRRMSKSVKMSTVAAEIALKNAEVSAPEAIIVGTGMGCEQDSEKFLRAVLDNEEEFLTPTHFIQSTHNTVAGQIALVKACHEYNFTYVNAGSSLEMALLDAQLQLNDGEASQILVGATDETAPRTMELYALTGKIKSEKDLPENLLNSSTNGVIWGEGAAFFSLENAPTRHTLATLKGTTFCNNLSDEELLPSIDDFLEKYNLQRDDIDAIMLGFSGDANSDERYRTVQNAFSESSILYFKHLCGEFNTASGFALFMATNILHTQRIPEVMFIENREKKDIRNILIYNHFFGADHSFTLLSQLEMP